MDLPFTIAYLDDTPMYSKIAEEHLDSLQQVSYKLCDANLSMKLSKCYLFTKEMLYLGNVLGATGIKPLPSKMAPIKLLKPLKNAKQVKAFLGLVGYYCKFIKTFAWIAKLHSLYTSRCKVYLDIRSPRSIQYSQKCFGRSTYPLLPKSFKTLHSIHRCLWWCLWSSVITGTWWLRDPSCISLPHIHRHTMEMEHYRTGSLWHLLRCNKVELLSRGVSHCSMQWPQSSTEISKW